MTPEEWRNDYLDEGEQRSLIGRWGPGGLSALVVWLAGGALGTPFVWQFIAFVILALTMDVAIWRWNRRRHPKEDHADRS